MYKIKSAEQNKFEYYFKVNAYDIHLIIKI